jgi:hypothetical protein
MQHPVGISMERHHHRFHAGLDQRPDPIAGLLQSDGDPAGLVPGTGQREEVGHRVADDQRTAADGHDRVARS